LGLGQRLLFSATKVESFAATKLPISIRAAPQRIGRRRATLPPRHFKPSTKSYRAKATLSATYRNPSSVLSKVPRSLTERLRAPVQGSSARRTTGADFADLLTCDITLYHKVTHTIRRSIQRSKL